MTGRIAGEMILTVVIGYLCIGCLAAFIGPAAKDIREEYQSLPVFPNPSATCFDLIQDVEFPTSRCSREQDACRLR